MEDPNDISNLSHKQSRLNMQKEQDKDNLIRRTKFWIRNHIIPETKYENEEVRGYARQLKNLYITNEGLLYRRFAKHDGRNHIDQLVIPKHLRKELLTHLHNAKTASHRGLRKTLEECRKGYYWPGYENDIQEWITNCLPCVQTKSIHEKHLRPPLLPVTAQTCFPGEMLQVDLLGPFTSSNGFTTVLTAIDVFTKYLFAVPLRRVTARAVTDVLTHLFLKHTYIPKVILTDKGSQFTSKLMKDTTDLLDIELKHATVKHPQTIGLLERAHAGIKKALRIYENSEHTNWHKFIDYAVFAHNTSYNPRTRTTPSDLFHGFEPFKALEARLNIPRRKTPEFETTRQLQERMRHLHKHQKQDIIQNYIKYKNYYDGQAQAFPLQKYTYCLLLNPKLDSQKQTMNKMEPKWLALYRVEKKINHENYLIRETNTHNTQIVHRIRLRSYAPRHKIKDLEHVDPEKFVQDPKFPEEYQQPAIFDRAKESLLWHPDLAENPDIEEKQEETITKKTPHGQSFVFTTNPRVRITRMQINGKTEKYKKQLQTAPPAPSKITPKIAAPNATTQRIIPIRRTDATNTPVKGPHKIIIPSASKQSLPQQTIASRIKESTRRVLPASIKKLLLNQVENSTGEQRLQGTNNEIRPPRSHDSKGEQHLQGEQIQNEAPSLRTSEQKSHLQGDIPKMTPPSEGNEPKQSSNSKPYLNDYKLTHMIGDESCKHCEDNNKRLAYDARLNFPESDTDDDSKEEDRRSRRGPNCLRWHWTNDPIKPEGKDNEYVILKFTTVMVSLRDCSLGVLRS